MLRWCKSFSLLCPHCLNQINFLLRFKKCSSYKCRQIIITKSSSLVWAKSFVLTNNLISSLALWLQCLFWACGFNLHLKPVLICSLRKRFSTVRSVHVAWRKQRNPTLALRGKEQSNLQKCVKALILFIPKNTMSSLNTLKDLFCVKTPHNADVFSKPNYTCGHFVMLPRVFPTSVKQI